MAPARPRGPARGPALSSGHRPRCGTETWPPSRRAPADHLNNNKKQVCNLDYWDRGRRVRVTVLLRLCSNLLGVSSTSAGGADGAGANDGRDLLLRGAEGQAGLRRAASAAALQGSDAPLGGQLQVGPLLLHLNTQKEHSRPAPSGPRGGGCAGTSAGVRSSTATLFTAAVILLHTAVLWARLMPVWMLPKSTSLLLCTSAASVVASSSEKLRFFRRYLLMSGGKFKVHGCLTGTGFIHEELLINEAPHLQTYDGKVCARRFVAVSVRNRTIRSNRRGPPTLRTQVSASADLWRSTKKAAQASKEAAASHPRRVNSAF